MLDRVSYLSRAMQALAISMPHSPVPAWPRAQTHLFWHTTEVNDRLARYAVAGTGEPLVLVHGLSGSTHWWRRNLTALAERYRLYLVDLPGFGCMGHWRGRFALAEAAEWLHAWMGAVGLPRACLVGHSMGGFICLQLAARWPTSVRRLVLVDPVGIPTGRNHLIASTHLLTAALRTSPRFYPTFVLDGLRAGPRAVLRAGSEILRSDVRDMLSRVSAPTLLVWGAHDTLQPVAAGAVMRDLLSDARLSVLDGAGHVAMFDRPHAFNHAVLRFLDARSKIH
jgi:pimeloyl-ACP methyl ester carboxylesterase